MARVWNKIDFAEWECGDICLSVNEHSNGPIVLRLYGDGYETYDLDEWMTPGGARELAAKLIEAADAADRAGCIV